MKLTLEICVDNLESAIAAIDGGADRIEVCSALALGGLTPNPSFLTAINTHALKKGRTVQLATMIRPRPGDFTYTPAEIFQMQEEIHQLKDLSQSLVFGCTTLKDGKVVIDEANCALLVRACQPKETTFHRAFDICSDLKDSCSKLINLGFTRLLTSGGQKNAIDGIEVIRSCVELSAGRMTIMAGSGVKDVNIKAIQEKTGVTELHSSGSLPKRSLMANECERIFQLGVASWQVTERSKVAAMRKILDNLETTSSTSLKKRSSTAAGLAKSSGAR